ncbi:Putative auto-transporter adhesin, head GIN domain [Flagellimonas taeanensis]|uniref:Auto-transporter adhesin, head GIN domain n=1 Tax=Flagellimonas taeanensis TaxID=1005926 RepID=A0A1M7AJH4_9FLAO|nr:head GIN domain-containing protein [Allomuricauda taeanensis]MEE1962669.1 head GIN domain-containing protein [Allomuricauda taeanensis]SFC34207.1 Putative auto-transporter adhesin, head GIN domain [Allomuricauda taeanensis]SHL42914.1 Putative auto-transporter adhesin, head GIN domain [Allomuricauda taeanensis]
MTTLARLAIAVLLSLFTSSCMMDMNFGSGKTGNGEVVEESRNVDEDFTVVSASEGIDVFVTQGAEFKITVEADENIIDLIGTDVREGRLKIHAIENIGRATKNVYVTLRNVDALESSSGADLIVQNIIETGKIDLDASSGSDLQVEVVADEISANASSGADIRISGKADMLYADASSGSDIKARDLTVKTCHADASSGADISVNVSESLVADASSGADISYTGDASVETKKSVSGSVRKY